MFQHSNVPGLARLLLRAQTELSDLLDAMSPTAREASHPLLRLQMGTTQFAMGLKERSVELSCTQGEQEYRLQLEVAPGKTPQAKAWLVDHATKQTRVLDGDAIFRGDVPPAFKSLHEEVTRHLKSLLPESLWRAFAADIAAQGKAPPTSAGETAPAANTPAAPQSGCASDAQIEATASAQAATPAAPSPAAPETAPADDGWHVYEIARREGADLRFTGKLVDAVRTRINRGRWTEFHVYQTKGGKFVGIALGRSLLVGESDRAETQVATSLEELAPFFGHSPLAKLLTTRLGVRQFQDIE